jgi:hypothetical protein
MDAELGLTAIETRVATVTWKLAVDAEKPP